MRGIFESTVISARPIPDHSFAPANPSLPGGSAQPDQMDPWAENRVVTFWRGRVALYAILKALGIGPGGAVIVPGFTCFAVPAAVQFAGAQPIYADIEAENFNLSLDSVRKAVSGQPGGAVRAVVIQHTFGIPADAEPIVKWARDLGIATIEDCAHVQGTRYRTANGWRPAGSLADAAFFSSQWTKPVPTGLGGWAVANDSALLGRIRQFRAAECSEPGLAETLLLASQFAVRNALSYPRLTSILKRGYQALYTRGWIAGTSSAAELRAEMPADFAKGMSRVQEDLLRRRMRDARIAAHRRRLKTIYDEALAAGGWPVWHAPEYADPVLLRYPVRVADKPRALAEANRRGLEIGDWYTSPVDRPKNLPPEVFGYREGMCPQGELAAAQTINLPMDSRVSERRAMTTVNFLVRTTAPAFASRNHSRAEAPQPARAASEACA